MKKMTKISKEGRLNSYWKIERPKDSDLPEFLITQNVSSKRLLNKEKFKLSKKRRKLPNIDSSFYLTQHDLLLNEKW